MCKNATLVNVIKTESVIGDGTKKDPVRIVIQYWDIKGNLIVTIDDYEPEIKSEASSDIIS